MRSIGSLVSLLAIATLTGRAQQPPQAGTALIIGQVVDGTRGTPLAGVVVTMGLAASSAAGAPPPPAPPEILATDRPRVLTGTDGRFVFRGVREGYVTFAAVKPGYIASRYGQRRPDGAGQWLLLASGQKLDGVTLFLWKQASISGRVVDEASEPIVKQQMLVYGWYASTGGHRLVGISGAAMTDDRGIYRIALLEPGDYVVALKSDNVAAPLSMYTSFRSSPRRSGSDVWLAPEPPGSSNSVRLGDSVVALGTALTPPPASPGAPLMIYPTTYYPSARTISQAEIVSVGSGEERSGIDIQAVALPTVRVSGTLVAPGDAAGALTLQLFQDAGDATLFGPESATTVTDAAGAFAFPLVTSGAYVLRAYRRPATTASSTGFRFDPSDSGYWAQASFAVGKADISGITIPLQPGRVVSGRVEFDGATARPARELLTNLFILAEPSVWPRADSSLPLPRGRVDDNGRFTAWGIPGGRYFVRPASSPPGWYLRSVLFNGRDVSDVPLMLDGSDATSLVVTFTDRATELKGSVVDGVGAGNDNAAVLIFPPDPATWASTGANPQRFRSARTTTAGGYAVDRLRPGDYLVVAMRDEEVTAWREPKTLELLSRVATAVHLEEGDRKTLTLRIQTVR